MFSQIKGQMILSQSLKYFQKISFYGFFVLTARRPTENWFLPKFGIAFVRKIICFIYTIQLRLPQIYNLFGELVNIGNIWDWEWFEMCQVNPLGSDLLSFSNAVASGQRLRSFRFISKLKNSSRHWQSQESGQSRVKK